MKSFRRIIKRWKKKWRPIQVSKRSMLTTSSNKIELVIIRRDDNGRPDNSVWLMGNVHRVSWKLFAIRQGYFVRTAHGQQYGAQLPTCSHKLKINKPFPLRQLCRDLGIRHVVVVKIILPRL
jgi:hypothetical protein